MRLSEPTLFLLVTAALAVFAGIFAFVADALGHREWILAVAILSLPVAMVVVVWQALRNGPK